MCKMKIKHFVMLQLMMVMSATVLNHEENRVIVSRYNENFENAVIASTAQEAFETTGNDDSTITQETEASVIATSDSVIDATTTPATDAEHGTRSSTWTWHWTGTGTRTSSVTTETTRRPDKTSTTTDTTTTEVPQEVCVLTTPNSSMHPTTGISPLFRKDDENVFTGLTDCKINGSSYSLSDENELTIYWTSLPFRTCQIRIYLTRLNCSDSCLRNSATIIVFGDNSYTFPEKLEACAEYEYKIVEVFENEELIPGERFTSREQVEEVALGVEQQDLDTLVATWKISEHLLCPNLFKVDFRMIDNVPVTWTVENPTAEFNNLEPCATYVLSVFPLKANVPMLDYGGIVNHTMDSTKPSGISNLTFDFKAADGDTLQINWRPPEIGSKCVEYYAVRINSSVDSRSKNAASNSESFANMFACVVYDVKVETRTLTTGAAPAVAVLPYQIPSRIFAAPAVPRDVAVTENSITLSTFINATEQKNFCNIRDVFFKCDDDQGVSRSKEVSLNGAQLSSMRVELIELKPFTEYKCTAKIRNQNSMNEPWGWSPESQVAHLTTQEGIPGEPLVYITESSANSCSFNWKAPKVPNGEIRQYKVYIKFSNFSYYNPAECLSDFKNDSEWLVGADETNFIFTPALPAAEYIIEVQAINNREFGIFSSPEICKTLAGPSDAVRNLEVLREKQEIGGKYNRTTVLKWNLPCYQNGKIDKFIIEAARVGSIETNPPIEVPVRTNQEEYFFSSEDFMPDMHYNLSIRAATNDVLGAAAFRSFDVEAGLPDLTNWNEDEIHCEPSTKNAKLVIPSSIFLSDVGRVIKILFLVAQLDCGNEVIQQSGFEAPRPRTWKEVDGEHCIPQYQTGSFVEENSKYTFQSARNDDAEENFIFTIGTDTHCDDVNSYCNGPLKPGTLFALTMRIFTRRGFSDTMYIKIKTEKEVPLILILISVLSTMCIVFVVVVGFYISYRKTRTLRQQSSDAPNDYKDITISEFVNFHREMIEGGHEKIKDEYSTIQTFSDSLEKTCIASKANEKLNRYSNISPFDYNRVVLNDDEFESDYINASYINGYHNPREYIASQGPKPNTGIDFWRMVLQHRVESIVMLTSLVEDNKIKCHEYFPKLNGQITFTNIRVTCSREEVHATFVKRCMEVEKDDVRHSVKHYYFTMWPDHGVPSNPSVLIEFCRMLRSERQKPNGSIIVHCSAGVGRTGTFIALDIMMQRMKLEKKINIFELVKQLRAQRMKMVQTLDQFTFLYDSALELVQAKAQQPQVLQNIALYMNDFKLFSRFKKETNGSILRHSESSL